MLHTELLTPGMFELVSAVQENSTKVQALEKSIEKVEDTPIAIALLDQRITKIEEGIRGLKVLSYSIIILLLGFLGAQIYETWSKVKMMPPAISTPKDK